MHPWIMPTEEESVMTYYITLGHVDTIAYPMVELIKKELDRATTIRREVRQGQPNVERLFMTNLLLRQIQGPVKKVDIYAKLGTEEKRDLRQDKNAKPGTPDYPRPPFSTQDF
ncbi:hypothetical protein FXO37_33869 [Capsicum annuum]|nr:hypothetical protein FXO37_33869 [Capsicum annuum]